MAIALVASAFVINKTTGGGGSGGTTGSVNTTGATLLTATFGYYPSGSVSDNMGNTWVQAVTINGFWQSNVFYVANPTVGSGHTFTLSGSYCDAQFAAWSGTATSPLDVTNSASFTGGHGGSCQPGSVTPSVASSLVIAHYIGNSGAVPTIGSSFVSIDAGDGGGAGGGAYIGAYLVPDTAAVNPTFGNNADGNRACTIAVFKPAAGSPRSLFLPSPLTGLGSGGSFFSDRLAA